ncbi:ecto-ADP-ribosyltransferase 4-like [Cebidichthys violaceus]|uniref:ecto-ADP-ribosyltransferase 4-like n=1 Tax=Cebidichthys violaceus TaxID=271503 RepID=UPI0035CB9D4F
MKANMLIFPPLCLLLCWMLPVDAKEIQLDLVEDSVDDRYLGCNEAMMKIIKDSYLEKEKKYFKWDRIEKKADKKFEERDNKDLTKEHIQAICLYTSPHVYKEFNEAVRTQKSKYVSSFEYHSLHYLLTSAIQILRDPCQTTYRRVSIEFTGEVKKIIRFGSFASSSSRPDVKKYGSKTCFEINTCYAARLNKYSFVYDYDQNKDPDEEVLIPPYEVFKITKKMKGPVKSKGLEDCEVLFVLDSAGVQSNLNCKVEQFKNLLLVKAKL